ncbi:MAG: 16S rRNA (adenine(1518)-N(6)/adenine(1519)-N(6))-dimethyltransferase RsmA [Alphaproteobacteria bacterium]|nr:16S rRNA (adenine(1518)-N(6)/adenine(1519)-N(6))-dimethyltransferase RsmA [Alphaproteobacteria bacterium]MBV8548985.1 16S rRNA (adenine(1518)-N(6)/adenine(1519)-N(6))-dimethyltransferase RsmA [Alphaproteobacteria bacterium]
MRTDTLPPLRDVIARHELAARKALGQHFLCDLNLTRAIVAKAGDLSGSLVCEVGPGPGGLTRALVDSDAAQIVAIEKDHRCLSALADIAAVSDNRLHVIEGDALRTDLLALPAAAMDRPRYVIANLPYNIGTELLIGWLKQMPAWNGLTLMFQAEVVDRITAQPNSKAFGRLSVLSQFCCNAERVMDIPARAFTPPPKIDSAVVHLTPRHDRPADVRLDVLERITATAFGQRRKMLRVSLKPLGGEALLMKAGIEPTLRAENLTVAQFETLTRLVQQA